MRPDAVAGWAAKLARWLANFIIGTVMLVVSLYFAVSLAITFLKLTGRIVEGQPLYMEFMTPTWEGLLVFQAVSVAILGLGIFLRRKLRGPGGPAR